MPETFGSYITRKRTERDISLRGLAQKVGISPVYMCNIEKDRRVAPSVDILDRMAVHLLLNRKEKAEMLDLAAKSQNTPAVAVDLPEYINERDIVRFALRTAKDAGATDAEWLEFIERLQQRIKKQEGE